MLEHYVSLLSLFIAHSALLHGLVGGIKILGLLFVLVAMSEYFCGGDLRRYLSRNFLTDLVYGLFYHGGVYNLLVYGPLLVALSFIPPVWHLALFERLPLVPGVLLFWFVADFNGYWFHRWQHSNNFLWLFHSVHHAQTKLTFVTSFRNHLFEQIQANVIMYVPVIIMGSPKFLWIPVFVLQNLFEGVQHSDLKWKYGPLYTVFVSPHFHAIHHSPQRSYHDSNYAKLFSFYDYIFGTISYGPRPSSFGLAGVDMPVSVIGTFLAPFRQARQLIWAQRSIDPSLEPEPSATQVP